MKTPVIAIVGRPNVGKSSLLNALSGRLISIVEDLPGVTRDRISTLLYVDSAKHGGRYVELVDTGGYGFDDKQGLTEHITHQIELAVGRADLVLFIVDCQTGLADGDKTIATLLRKADQKVVLLANKADGDKADLSLGDFSRLGFGSPVPVSALAKRNFDQLYAAIGKNVDLSNAPETIPKPQMHVAIVGKRNAGKSTLVNAIAKLYDAGDDRVIVSEVPGTTRDSVDVRFDKDGKTLIVIDTAGVRKKRHMVNDDIEFYGFHRAQRSIRRADVVLLLLDATLEISEPDKKLAQYLVEEYKPSVIVVNKWDLAKEQARAQLKLAETIDDGELMEKYAEYIGKTLRGMPWAPVAFVTAKDGRNVQAVIDLSQHLFKQANERLTTGRLNRALRQVLDERLPSTPRGERPKIYYATQIGVSPPTIALVVNNPKWVNTNYQRYVLNRFRDLLPYPEVPIKLTIRPRGKGKTAREEEAAAGLETESSKKSKRGR